MQIKYGLLLLISSIVYAVVAKAENIDALINEPGVYTLTNLHPDESRAKLYATNYQQFGLIPLCTEVVLLDRGRKRLVFRVKSTGREYSYDHHRNAGEALVVNLARNFGKECVKNKVAKLSKIDQKGIQQGKALVGMSKQGVIYAIGYPPLTRTPTLELNTWKYWTNRFNTFDVTFDNKGIVTRVVD